MQTVEKNCDIYEIIWHLSNGWIVLGNSFLGVNGIVVVFQDEEG